jgi:hypothetical protein
MCVFEFVGKKITLTKINPDCSIEEVRKNTGFNFELAEIIGKMILVDDKVKKIIGHLDPLNLRDLEIKEERYKVIEKLIYS